MERKTNQTVSVGCRWANEPLGLMRVCLQCKDCVFQYITRGELSKFDWFKANCLIFTEESGLIKPAEIIQDKENCPHKLSFEKIAQMYEEQKKQSHKDES